jgi:hypothetical protein
MLSIIMNIVGYYDGFAISPASSSSRSSSSASSGGVAICGVIHIRGQQDVAAVCGQRGERCVCDIGLGPDIDSCT